MWNIFCLLEDLCVKTGTRFLLRDKRLFELSEFEITRVDCSLPSDRSKAVPLLQILFVSRWNVTFVLPLFVPHLSFCSFRKAVIPECGMTWSSSHILIL